MPPDPPTSETCLLPGEVQVGTANGPGIYAAEPGTQIPGIGEDWTDWDCLGYLSEDGPTVGSSTDSTDITPWQSVVPIRSVITARGVTLQFVMWQLNARTLAMYFDTDVPEADNGDLAFDIRTDTPQHLYAIGIDAADADRVLRLGFYRASLSAAGDMQITRGSAIPLDVTLSALDDGGRLAHVALGGGIQPASAVTLSRSQVQARRTQAPAPSGT